MTAGRKCLPQLLLLALLLGGCAAPPAAPKPVPGGSFLPTTLTSADLEDAKQRLRAGAILLDNIDPYQEPLIVTAAKHGDLELVDLLVARGQSVDSQRRHGETALHAAAAEDRVGVCRYLVEHGAHIEAPSRDWKVTPLITAAQTGSVGALRYLIEQGARLEARDGEYGMTPLMWSSELGHTEVVRELLRAGALRSARDKRGRTPLRIVRDALVEARQIEREGVIAPQRDGVKAVIALLERG